MTEPEIKVEFNQPVDRASAEQRFSLSQFGQTSAPVPGSFEWPDATRLVFRPDAPLVLIAVLSQVANGMLLPFVLIFILLLVNRRDLMGEQTNSRTYNVLAWGTTVTMIVITLVLLYLSIFTPSALQGTPAGR